MAISLPPVFNVPIDEEGGEIGVLWKGEYRRTDAQIIIDAFRAININPEQCDQTIRIGYSNLPTTEPFTGFAEQVRKRIVQPSIPERQLLNVQGVEDYTLPQTEPESIIARVLLAQTFPTEFDGRTYAVTHHLLSSTPDWSGVSSKQSRSKYSSDFMKLICIGEALEDIVEQPRAGMVVNVTSFDEVPYAINTEHLQRLKFFVGVKCTHYLKKNGKENNVEGARLHERVYELVKDHYLHSTRARIEAQVFTPRTQVMEGRE